MLTRATSTAAAFWEMSTKGMLEQVLITCSDEDYNTGMDIKKEWHSINNNLNVRLIVADRIVFEDDEVLEIEEGEIAITYFYSGHWLARSSAETHILEITKETK